MDARFFQPGLSIWVPNPYGDESDAYRRGRLMDAKRSSKPVYVPGKVTEMNQDGHITVQTDWEPKVTIQCQVTDIHPTNIVDEVDDLVNLAHLNDATLLHSVQARFHRGAQQQIYTWAGPILIAVNPYKVITDKNGTSIYDKVYIEQYRQASKNELQGSASPHIYGVAANAVSTFCSQKANQSVVISGESGAGKTESTKQIMQYITSCSSSRQADTGIEVKLLRSNPVLEAFGNAKTLRNDNSSRFGKFIQILMNDNHGDISIVGGMIKDFLLEKSRITNHVIGERNYHIFYQLLEGSSNKEKETLKLLPKVSYRYLNPEMQEKHAEQFLKIANSFPRPPTPPFSRVIDDKQGFKELVVSMKVVGFNEEKVASVFKIVSGVMSLGNIELSDDGDTSSVKNGVGNAHAKVVAEMFGLNLEQLVRHLVVRETTTGKTVIQSPLDRIRGYEGIDALAKATYGKLFRWIVKQINSTLNTDEATSQSYIGILDIFGFEVFQKNGFEQLCINFANEMLHQLFTTYVFKMEEKLYKEECIDYSTIVFEDNSKIIELIEKKPVGVLCLLDEACLFPKSSDETFLNKLNQVHVQSAIYERAGIKQTKYGSAFVINHSAAPVIYTVADFLSKNRDRLESNITGLMMTSSVTLIRDLFNDHENENTRSTFSGANAFLGSKFKDDIHKLMDALYSTTPHFVRCLKANGEKRSGYMDPNLVMHQLRYLGVLDSIRIRHSGFSFRTSYQEFYSRFALIVPELQTPAELNLSDGNPQDACKVLVSHLWKLVQSVQRSGKASPTNMESLDSFLQFGTTQIFIRKQMIQTFEALREVKLRNMISAATLIQSCVRMVVTRNMLLGLQKGLDQVQSAWRSKRDREAYLAHIQHAKVASQYAAIWMAKHHLAKGKRNAVILQSFLRGSRSRLYISRLKTAASMIQSVARSSILRNRFRVWTKCVCVIQSCGRSFLIRNRIYWKKVEATLTMQSAWRGHVTRQSHPHQMSQLASKRLERLKIGSSKRIQATWLMKKVRSRFHFLKNTAKTIQYWMQGFIQHSIYLQKLESNRTAQRLVRGFIARQLSRRILTQKMLDHEMWRINQARHRENISILASAAFQQHQVSAKSGKSVKIHFASTPASKEKTVHKTLDLDIARDLISIYPECWSQCVSKVAVAMLSIGVHHTALLTTTGEVLTWGLNFTGQLGHGHTERIQAPTIIAAFSRPSADLGANIKIVSIASGDSHSLALSSTGQVFSWGDGSTGQLGHGTTRACHSPQPIDTLKYRRTESIHCGSSFSVCVVTAGAIYSWGGEGDVLGQGVYTSSGLCLKPKPITALATEKIASLSCGRDFVIASTKTGRVFTWGRNQHGQLGTGNTATRLVPKEILQGHRIHSVAAGTRHCAVVDSNGRLYMWGCNSNGQVAASGSDVQLSPSLVYIPSAVKQVVCGWRSTTILASEDGVYVCGVSALHLLKSQKTGDDLLASHLDGVVSVAKPAFVPMELSDVGRVPKKLISSCSLTCSFTGMIYHQKPATFRTASTPLFGDDPVPLSAETSVEKLLVNEKGEVTDISKISRHDLEKLVHNILKGETDKLFISDGPSGKSRVKSFNSLNGITYQFHDIACEKIDVKIPESKSSFVPDKEVPNEPNSMLDLFYYKKNTSISYSKKAPSVLNEKQKQNPIPEIQAEMGSTMKPNSKNQLVEEEKETDYIESKTQDFEKETADFDSKILDAGKETDDIDSLVEKLRQQSRLDVARIWKTHVSN